MASNDRDVLLAIKPADRAKELEMMDLRLDHLPVQRTLGMSWNLNLDLFTFKVELQEKPFTRRGILSTLHTIYDPLGLVAPVILPGSLLFRDLVEGAHGWDDPLPDGMESAWLTWCKDVAHLSALEVPRVYVPGGLGKTVNREVHIFTDASERVISCVAFLKATNDDGESHAGFLLGKSKVSPKHGHTIPRLELCAAVMAAEMSVSIITHLDISIDSVTFYTDSRVVLGYINNRSRRFFTYVTNGVSRILKVSEPKQWKYIPTGKNPADIGTRGIRSKDLQESMWIQPPLDIMRDAQDDQTHELVNAAADVEVRPEVTCAKTKTESSLPLGTDRFSRFSTWSSLVSGIGFLVSCVRRRKGLDPNLTTNDMEGIEALIIRSAQRDAFEEEYSALKGGQRLSKSSHLLSLNPFMDSNGLLRVGGRLDKSELSDMEKHPVIVPRRCHVGTLLIRRFHEKTSHQGRHMTEGSIRSAGFWILGMKKQVSSIIHQCVLCRRLRRKTETQIMADLPSDRLKPAPPFSYVGVDTFGHWNVFVRKSRGVSANAKRWAILFTCLCTRAIHIEVVEEMSTASFLNAVRRFISLRGKVREFRSDRGTNFVGSTEGSKSDCVNVEDKTIKRFLLDEGTSWVFNPPHASHFGGAWERMIGVARRILDSLLLQTPMKQLTHEVLVTLLAEVTGIVKSRPIVPVSTDPEDPTILTPSVLLIHKVNGDIVRFENFDVKDLYRSQWLQVQTLATMFWKRWRVEYVQMLQERKKWKEERRNIECGDVVILKEKDCHRNDWPLGLVVEAVKSDDGCVRKVMVRVMKHGQPCEFFRPISEVVLLLSV